MSLESTYERPWMYQEQLEAVFTPKRYAVCEASTKSGKTVSAMAWLLEMALTLPPTHYWWVAPSRKQAKIAFDRTRRGLPRGLGRVNRSEQTITLPNGHTLHYLTGEKPDLLYGEDVGAVVMDEYTRLREEAWHAVRSTLTATKGPVRFIGNVRGTRNWGYKLARRAETNPHWKYTRITWREAVKAGVLDEAEIRAARDDLPENVFRELYEAVPSDDDTNPFGMARVRACVTKKSPRPTAAWGWDLAKSVDFTCGIGLDADCAWTQYEHWQRPWKETIADILRFIGEVPAVIDSTGVGDAVVEMLQRRGRKIGARILGFKFTQTSRQQLLEGLRLAIHERAVRIPTDIVDEFEAFEYVYTRLGGVKYAAPEGLHDDKVMAIALAVHGVHTVVRDPLVIRFADEEPDDDERDEELAERRAIGIAEIEDGIESEGAWGFDVD